MKSRLFPPQVKRVLLVASLALLVYGGGGSSDIGTNGQHRRPFYIVGHNPNTQDELNGDLDAGANALEPDIMRFSDNATYGSYKMNDLAGPSGLFIYHDDVLTTTRLPLTVEFWLEHCRQAVTDGKNVALLTIDIKSPAAKANWVKNLQAAVHTYLNPPGVLPKINVIYSVGSISDADNAFPGFGALLDDNEGIMIDAENDPVDVVNHLRTNYGAQHFAFGNGSIGVTGGSAPHVLPSIDMASWLRVNQYWDRNHFLYGTPGFGMAVPYSFPIPANSDLANTMIGNGIDGLITDLDLPAVAPASTQKQISDLKAIIDGDPNHYVATAADNPFYVPVEGYGLKVHTADILNAGTVEDLTFTLYGTCGSAAATINANFQNRYGRNDTNYVTIYAKNLGPLTGIRLQSDGSNTWKPGTIVISSARWGIPPDSLSIDFGGAGVDSDFGQFKSIPAGWGYQCDTVAPSASPTYTPSASSFGWYNADVQVNWNWADNNGGSGIAPARCTSSSNTSGEGSVFVQSSCSDADGNVGSIAKLLQVDKTPPTVNCGGSDGQWHASDVSVVCAASDALSGLASSNDIVFSLTTSVPANTETANASTNSRIVLDKANNSGTAGPIGGNKIDKKPPVISIVQPAATQYTHSSTLTLNYSAVDGGSGVKTVTATIDGNSIVGGSPVANGLAINLLTALSLGQHTLTVNSVDNVGNTSSASIQFTIIVSSQSIVDDVTQFTASGAVQPTNGESLVQVLSLAKDAYSGGRCPEGIAHLNHFIQLVQARTPGSITPTAAAIMIADAQYLMLHCPV